MPKRHTKAEQRKRLKVEASCRGSGCCARGIAHARGGVRGARVEQEMMQEVPLPLAGEGVELRMRECEMARGRTRREEGVLAQEVLDSAQEEQDMT